MIPTSRSVGSHQIQLLVRRLQVSDHHAGAAADRITFALMSAHESAGLRRYLALNSRLYCVPAAELDQGCGLDIGTIARVDEMGIQATNDKNAVLTLDADLAVHSPRYHKTMTEHDSDVVALESGKNVTSIMGYHHLRGLGSKSIRKRCEKGGATIFGTGIDHGSVCERLPRGLTGLSNRIDKLRTLEHYDRGEASPMMLAVMGFDLYLTTSGRVRSQRCGIRSSTTLFATPNRLGADVECIDRTYELPLSAEDQPEGLPVAVEPAP